MQGMELRIGFIGAGAMAEALIRGLIKAGTNPEDLIASDIQPERLNIMHKTYGIKVFDKNLAVFQQSDVVVLAVKPQHLDPVLQELMFHDLVSHELGAKPMVISIAAG
ncbi:MAG: NAD(P)-binding domain-containing protein, partial [Syntrophomonadaceae bacterium]|nr:NAD(P)-binding domain-containing protein [Syntrophomonadaceae bacterium]